MLENSIFPTPSFSQLYADSDFSLAIRQKPFRTISEVLDFFSSRLSRMSPLDLTTPGR